MTITEGGYSLDKPNPTIEAIASGLDARRVGGGAPLTILSCDNLPGNGKRRAAGDHDGLRGAESPSSPASSRRPARSPTRWSTASRRRPPTTIGRGSATRSGIDDGWPVVAEPFRQWVIEDRFANGRPRFEDVGVLFTDDVHDWELYKLRMLNATHSCMAYLMALAGVVYVDEAMAIPAERRYLEQFLARRRSRRSRRSPGIRLRTTGRRCSPVTRTPACAIRSPASASTGRPSFRRS